MGLFSQKFTSFRVVATGLTLSGLAACAELEDFQTSVAQPKPQPQANAPETQSELPLSSQTSAADLDDATASEKAKASRTVGGRVLGSTIASLGTPSEPGFWLKTPLVKTESPGAVRSAETGQRIAVTLIPIDGPATAGSRISLSAMRLLELPLTELAELEVTLGG